MKLKIYERGDLLLAAGFLSKETDNFVIRGGVWNKEKKIEENACLQFKVYEPSLQKELAQFLDEEIIVLLGKSAETGERVAIRLLVDSGIVSFPEDETGRSEVNIIFGNCIPKKINEKLFKLSIPLKGEDNLTTWYNIAFWDDLATRCEKCFPRSRTAIIVAGRLSEYNGQPQCNGYRFEF